MSQNNYLCGVLAVFSILLLLPGISHSQIIRATGTSTETSSQLVYYYDQVGSDGTVQVTNTNDTEGVWIHVKIFRSLSDGTVEAVCEERNFVDFLTPNDTHIYDLDNANFPKNIGETGVTPGESTSIDVNDTVGFVIITPVVSETDLTAISFQYLMGTTQDDGDDLVLNAIGRDAVDFTTGAVVPLGTPLDGVNNGYVLLQPDELVFNFAIYNLNSSQIEVVGISFSDMYGPPGLLGYQAIPSSANWTTFLFDFKESPTSCGVRPLGCFISIGLNDSTDSDLFLDVENNEIENFDVTDARLCEGASSPDYDPDNTISGSFEVDTFGWTRIFISGLDGFTNHIGALRYDSPIEGAYWMHSKKN